MEDKKDKMIVRDWLAVERTKLANERTFLSYFRSSVVFFGSGLGILKIDFFSDVKSFGSWLIVISLVILCIGITRFFYVRKKIDSYYKEN